MIKLSEGKERTEWKNPPVGAHVARCIRVEDLGSQETEFQGETSLKRKIRLSFELPNERMEIEVNGEKKSVPHIVFSNYNASLAEKSYLRKDLESWRGRPFTKDEISSFDLASIVGKPAMLTLAQGKDPKFVNVVGISGLPKGMECPPVELDQWEFSIETPNWEVFKKMSRSSRLKLAKCPEFANIQIPPDVSVLILSDKEKAASYG